MNAWTDDELGDLLRETFHAHEEADDADDAVRIAWRNAYPVRRRGVRPTIAAVAAGVVVVGSVAGVATYAHQHRDTGSVSASAGSAATGAATDTSETRAANRAAAAATAKRLLRTLALPAGAIRRHSAPLASLRSLGGGPIVGHPVTATGFWVVPATTAEAVQTYITAHTAAGMTASTGSTSTHTPTTEWTALTVTETARQGSAAYAPPELDIDVIQNGADVAVRADAFLNWRSPRPDGATVTGDVTGADIETAAPVSSGSGPASAGPVTTAEVGAPEQVRRLVRLVNGLPGVAPLGPHGCFALPAGPLPHTTLVLRSTDGTWRFTRTDDCSDVVSVQHDGRRVGVLDDDGFLEGIAAIAK